VFVVVTFKPDGEYRDTVVYERSPAGESRCREYIAALSDSDKVGRYELFSRVILG
jgi:hypothetical protein